jgi:vancomycin resistance protein YoaR
LQDREIRLTKPEEDAAVPAASLGARLHAETTVGRAYAVGREGNVFGRLADRVRAPFGVGVPAEVGYGQEDAAAWVRGVAERETSSARDATVGISGTDVSVTPSRPGYALDEPATLRRLDEALKSLQTGALAAGEVERPALTTAEAERLKPTRVLGSYCTDYSAVPDDGTRVENLSISSELDYDDSKVIVGGVEVDADGGLCQVTSTLYNAANFAGLDVTERSPHSAQLPYIRPGMDATVWWGSPGRADDLDMKFRNTTGGYLLLREYVADAGYVYAKIWGRQSGTEVEMYSEPAYVGTDGSEWVTHQKITRGGEVVYDGVLHRDTHDPWSTARTASRY